VVTFKDLDLQTPERAETLYRRIQRARKERSRNQQGPHPPLWACTDAGHIVKEQTRAESVAFRLQCALNSPRRTTRHPPEQPRAAPENRLVESTPSTGESSLESTARDETLRARFDKTDLEAIIAREYAGLRLLISRRAGDPQVGADLLNDALCITWEKWQARQIDRADCIAGYIFQVAMNLLRNHRRSAVERPDRRAATSVLDTLEHDAAGDHQIEDRLAARVKAALGEMGGARDREVLLRFYFRDEDGDTICRDLNLTPQQLARVLHRARGRLRKLLESEGVKKGDLFSVLLIA
jgi:RNA polymerase sigma factor (sigma-70 family)